MPKHERMLEFYLDGDLVREAYAAYKGLTEAIRRSLVYTPTFCRLHFAFSRETRDGNLAALIDRDYYAFRRSTKED